jgi:hypothetical protein
MHGHPILTLNMSYVYKINVFTGKLDMVNFVAAILYSFLLENTDNMLKENGGKLLLEG